MQVLCPVCGIKVDANLLPKTSEGLTIIAIDHGSHVVIVKYDQFNMIRDFNIYFWDDDNNLENGVKLRCNHCGVENKIDVYDHPNEFVFNHLDHVFFVNLISEDLIIPEIIPLIKVEKFNKSINPLSILLKNMDYDQLASIIVEGIYGHNNIQAPDIILGFVKELYKRIGLNEKNLKPGDLRVLDDDDIEFFIKLIEKNEIDLDVLLDKLKASIKLINKLVKMIYKLEKNDFDSKAYVELINLLKRKKLYKIVTTKLKEKYEIS